MGQIFFCSWLANSEKYSQIEGSMRMEVEDNILPPTVFEGQYILAYI